jgi:tRNA pseudouridine13 synthase
MPEQPNALPDWGHFMGPPACRGVLRAEIDDFRVQELPRVEPEGEGNHLWLEVEKRNANTDWLARQLAALAGVPARDVGFAGMKDRRGVTTQWFSVGLQEARDREWEQWDIPDAMILRAVLHPRKLKRGTLRGNRFRLVLRQVEGPRDELEERLRGVGRQGVPNYFGPQRFGHGGRNVARGIKWLEHGGRLPRNKRSLYLSSVRSYLFNEVLSERVGLGNWDSILDGDAAILDGSRSTFPCAMPDPDLDRRCREFDIHPSGPLPGGGESAVAGEAAEIESKVLGRYEKLIHQMDRAGLKAARRGLRLLPGRMDWSFDGSSLILGFELQAGGYATSVLRELVSTDPDSISETK